MIEDDEGGDAGADLGRTMELSDGIFAIAMTLLAFQVQPPDVRGAELAHALGKMGSRYYVFALSFSVIGLFWLAHHRLFRQVRRADEMLMSLNLLFLMLVAALPFPSAVLARYGGQRAAVILYASAMALAGLLLMALTVVAQRRRLLAPTATNPTRAVAGRHRGRPLRAVHSCGRCLPIGGALHLDRGFTPTGVPPDSEGTVRTSGPTLDYSGPGGAHSRGGGYSQAAYQGKFRRRSRSRRPCHVALR